MSTLLEQAIIDAKALREAAIKSAEQTIVEKYAPEVKRAVEALLEQEMIPPLPPDPMAMGGSQAPPPMVPPPGAPGPAGGLPPEAAAMASPVASNANLAATNGEKLCPCPEDDETIEVNLRDLAAAVNAEEAALEQGMPPDAAMAMGAAAMQPPTGPMGAMPPMPSGPPSPLGPGGPGMPAMQESQDAILRLTRESLQEVVDSEEVQIPDEVLAGIAEAIRANFSAPDSGMGGALTPSSVRLEGDEIAAAELNVMAMQEENSDDEEVVREVGADIEHQKQITEHVKQLQSGLNHYKQENNKFRNLMMRMQSRLTEINLANAKLIYTNRVLTDPSLNERQRNRIVEAISKSGSVEEAKVIYDTLQDAVGEKARAKSPQSLREAVSRDRSLLLPRRRKESSAPDAQALERMKALAGLTNKKQN